MLGGCVDRESTIVEDEVGDIFLSSRRGEFTLRNGHFNRNLFLSIKIKDPVRPLCMILRAHKS
jgi:hypothetical protein